MPDDEPLSTGRNADRGRIALAPNALSAARLVLGLAFPWVPDEWRPAAVAGAAATDFLDGRVARWLRAESDFGRAFDPAADKVFVLMLVGTLVAEGVLAPWWAVAAVLRDLVVLAGVGYAAAVGRRKAVRSMRPTRLGKATTAAQFSLLLGLTVAGGAWDWLVWPTTLLSGLAAADYARRTVRPRPGAGLRMD